MLWVWPRWYYALFDDVDARQRAEAQGPLMACGKHTDGIVRTLTALRRMSHRLDLYIPPGMRQ